MCYCYVPQLCESLSEKPVMLTFGKTMLKSIYDIICKQILDKFLNEKSSMTEEKQDILLHQLPR